MDMTAAKRTAGQVAAELVEDGMTVGLGTGSTAHWFILAIATRVRNGMTIRAVATSLSSERLAREHGIDISDLDARGIDLAVDGADQVDPDLRLIKGFGGALVREKVVAAAARRFVVVVDPSKVVDRLSGRVPLELLPFGVEATLAALAETGGVFSLRDGAGGEPLRSDNGNLLGDGRFGVIDDPEGLAELLDSNPGVIGHGMFLGMADSVLVGEPTGVRTMVAAGRG
jgi:ribose 5-phosphate isomerase A